MGFANCMENSSISITYRTSPRDRPLSAIRIRAAAGNPRRGWLTAGGQTVPVALGRGGIRANKREGDGGTPKGHVPAAAIVVARRPPPQAADISAGSRDPARRRLVRGPRKPPLQPAGTAGARSRRRSAQARRPPLRFHCRDRSQQLAADRRPRQRGIPASGAREFRTDRRVRFDDEDRRCCGCCRGSGHGPKIVIG